MQHPQCFNQSSTIQNYITMGKKITRDQELKQDISTEMDLLQIKAAQRSLSSNWYHHRYIWMLISELNDDSERIRRFALLDVIADKFKIRRL